MARNIKHAPPGWSRRKLAEPKEGKARFREDGNCHGESCLHDDGRESIGQNVLRY
ncbi:hypothetical protein MAE02_50260 [Microvirga aerophila]|uniref:Uncharacterized protein n=1 Tax=Microvirga aerophila TaxID=670291 RepID=A0A512BZH0_9HYPH|nr:hypothetical protein MAE02_50260 [Microvirga aerophila]